MTNRVEAYWSKSQENREVSEYSFKEGKLNAAASRYYYALYQACWAFMEAKGVPVPEEVIRGGRLIKNRNNSWPKPELADEVNDRLNDFRINPYDILNDALEQRARADYEAIPVEPDDLELIISRGRELLQKIGKHLDL